MGLQPMYDIPREYQGWELMPAKTLVGFWEQVGTVAHGESEWTLGRSATHLVIYLMTDLPHPDDETQTCRFQRKLVPDFEALCTRLTGAERATTEEISG